MNSENLYDTSVFIFRRDLRIFDNTGLLEAMMLSKYVIPLFILTPTQIEKNKYKSSNAIQFMMESLYDLDKQINEINKNAHLWIYYGDELDILNIVYDQIKYNAIFVNEDYSPYSIKRDKKIKNYCKNKIDFKSYHDCLLIENIDSVCTNNGEYYKIFTSFYNKAIKQPVRSINKITYTNFKSSKKNNLKKIDYFMLDANYYQINDKIAINGGRDNGKKILKNLKKFNTYDKTRNYPNKSTTMLSAHNKFGTLSIREVYKAFKHVSDDLVKQLYWRDFYYYICVHYPEIFNYDHLYKQNNKIKWNDNVTDFNKWKNAKTGFPIVDAAMRQLNQTGYMHNRCRMITAMFLVKDLLIDWKNGERYFTKKLIDIDRCQNIGNWNWSSSFGLDNAAFIRIFNPWTQSKEYDNDCEYIKKWIPELKDVDNNHIHKWYKYYDKYPNVKFPVPMIDHSEAREKFLHYYN